MSPQIALALEITSTDLAFLNGRLSLARSLVRDQRQGTIPILRDIAVRSRLERDALESSDAALYDWLSDYGCIEHLVADATITWDESGRYGLSVEFDGFFRHDQIDH